MARQLKVLGANFLRASRGFTPVEHDRIALSIISVDLKSHPVHHVELTESEALKLATQLINAVRYKNGEVG